MSDTPEPPPPADDQIQAFTPSGAPVGPQLPPPEPAGPRYCLRCGHRLHSFGYHDLTQPRCPECSLPYNPTDSATYAVGRVPQRRQVWLVSLFLVIAYGVIGYVWIFNIQQEHAEPQLGTALFLAIPFSVGALLGFLTRPGIWKGVLLIVQRNEARPPLALETMELTEKQGSTCIALYGGLGRLPS